MRLDRGTIKRERIIFNRAICKSSGLRIPR
jgi:hypothetical protein